MLACRLEIKVRELEAEKERLETMLREKEAVVARLVAKHRHAMAQLEPMARELQELQIKHRSSFPSMRLKIIILYCLFVYLFVCVYIQYVCIFLLSQQ